jgi:6-phosphogluconolactonase
MNAQPTAWRVLKNDHEVARAATAEILAAVRAAIGEGHSARIALSGGHTPSLMYRLWAEEFQAQFPWEQMELYWGDERCVPAADPLSNFRMVREALLDRLPKPPPYFPMPAAQPDHDAAAREYEATLRRQIPASEPSFDALLLGIGEEGHTASLFPGSPALAESARWVVPVTAPAQPPLRLTLTLPVLSRAMNVFFLVTGESKRDIVHAIRTEPDAPRRYPAAMVQSLVKLPGRVVWFLDQAAARPGTGPETGPGTSTT